MRVPIILAPNFFLLSEHIKWVYIGMIITRLHGSEREGLHSNRYVQPLLTRAELDDVSVPQFAFASSM